MFAAHADWENGIHPVSTGAAPWLPAVFVEAMHAVRGAINRARGESHERSRQRAKVKVTHGR